MHLEFFLFFLPHRIQFTRKIVIAKVVLDQSVVIPYIQEVHLSKQIKKKSRKLNRLCQVHRLHARRYLN
jgi:hypothetical protein